MIPSYQLPPVAEPNRAMRSTFNTPEPLYAPPTPPRAVVAAPVPDRRARIRAAAHRALQLYPGPVGNLVKRELEAAEEWGQAIDAHGLTMQVVDHILRSAL